MLELQLEVKKKIGGAGYFIEELSNEQFASYEEVTSLAGVTQGTLINEGSGWLRFDYEGTELIVAKKTMRHSISWDHLNSVGCVFGSKVITILGNQYKVRLLTGADTDPSVDATGYYVEGTHNSEWSHLFYPLITDDSYVNAGYTGYKDPRYTMSQLQMNTKPYSWCQETHQNNPANRVIRGYTASSYLAAMTSSSNNYDFLGWRPCLELVS